MVLQPEEPKISLSGVHHFARAASEFESSEGVFLFPELRIISTITREVEPDGEGDEDPTGDSPCSRGGKNPAPRLGPSSLGFGRLGACCCSGCASAIRPGPECILPWGTHLEGPSLSPRRSRTTLLQETLSVSHLELHLCWLLSPHLRPSQWSVLLGASSTPFLETDSPVPPSPVLKKTL